MDTATAATYHLARLRINVGCVEVHGVNRRRTGRPVVRRGSLREPRRTLHSLPGRLPESIPGVTPMRTKTLLVSAAVFAAVAVVVPVTALQVPKEIKEIKE